MNQPIGWRRALRHCAGALVLSLLALSPARAALQNEMESMFNSMILTTTPLVFDTSMRGVIAGGGFNVRNRIVTERLVSFVPPSFEAGCGGIDLFAGSFSFINAEQFTQLLRAIAMNASGYAFQLALRSMCLECMNTIETLQRKVQELSQFFGNSCQLAQGIVNDGARAMGAQVQNDASVLATISGVGDVFQSWTNTTGTSPVRQVMNNAPARVAQRIQGNIVWRALRRQGVTGWFAFGDLPLLEVMMNVSGTVIVGDPATDAAASGENFQVRVLAPKAHLLSSLITGGRVVIEGCDDFAEDACRNLVTKTIDIRGFEQMLVDVLLGTAGSRGLVQKIASNEPLTVQEQQIFGALPSGVGALIVRLSSYSAVAGRALVEKTAPQVALELARGVMLSLVSGAEAAVGASDHPHTQRVVGLLREARAAVTAEALHQQSRFGSLVDTVRAYTDLLAVLPTTEAGRSNLVPASLGDAPR